MIPGALLVLLASASIDPEIGIVEIGGRFSFDVRAATDLPDETLLHFKILYVTERLDPTGRPIEETVWMHQDREGLEARDRVRNGAASAMIGSFARRPPPIRYRVEITGTRGGDTITGRADTAAPTLDAVQAHLQTEAARTREDFHAIDAMFHELEGQFLTMRGHADAAAMWSRYAEGFRRRLDDMDRANADRFEVWAFWIEARGKMGVTGLVDALRNLTGPAGAGLADERVLEEALDAMHAFTRQYDDTRAQVGVEEPFDPTTVADDVAALQSLIDRRLAGEEVTREWEEAALAVMPRLAETHGPALQRVVIAFRDGEGLEEAWRAFRELIAP